MRLVGFTEELADLRVRYMVLHMDRSAMVWADAVSPGSTGKTGSLPSLALSMPPRSPTCVPSTAAVLPGAGSVESRALAESLTRRTGLAIHAHINLPANAEALADKVALRLLREIESELNINQAT